jgi:hypothetical protein
MTEKTIEIPYPFVQEKYTDFDEDGPFDRLSWHPGVLMEWIAPDGCEAVAHGMGMQILTIVSEHKPLPLDHDL